MGDEKTKDKDGHCPKFLLVEYRAHRESFWKSEEIGEKRVNFFLTLATAVLAALAIRDKGILVSGGKVDPMFFYGLGAVLLFGIVTLLRLIHRNLESSKELRALGRIRAYFAGNYPAIKKYLSYEPRDDKPIRKKEWKQIISFGTGGLVESVALVNSLIVAALCALFAICRSGWITGLSGLIGFILAWVVQFWYVKLRYNEKKPEPHEIKFPGN